MPDLTNLTKWVRHDGKNYCWEKSAGKVVEVKIADVPFEQVHKDVLIAMLNSTAEKK